MRALAPPRLNREIKTAVIDGSKPPVTNSATQDKIIAVTSGQSAEMSVPKIAPSVEPNADTMLAGTKRLAGIKLANGVVANGCLNRTEDEPMWLTIGATGFLRPRADTNTRGWATTWS